MITRSHSYLQTLREAADRSRSASRPERATGGYLTYTRPPTPALQPAKQNLRTHSCQTPARPRAHSYPTPTELLPEENLAVQEGGQQQEDCEVGRRRRLSTEEGPGGSGRLGALAWELRHPTCRGALTRTTLLQTIIPTKTPKDNR